MPPMPSNLSKQSSYTVRHYRRLSPGAAENLVGEMQFDAADPSEAIAIVESALAPKFKLAKDRIELLDEEGSPVWCKNPQA